MREVVGNFKRKEQSNYSAESVLDWIYEYMEQDGYEDMFVHLWDGTSEEFKQRMQGLLDEISNFPSAKVYDIDEDINPFTNWKVSR